MIFISLCLLFLLGNRRSTGNQLGEHILPLSEILLYCNIQKFIKDLAENSYMLDLAASGNINDGKHRELLSMELLMNKNNNQWAIIFNYKQDRACIIGGNHIRLYSPKN